MSRLMLLVATAVVLLAPAALAAPTDPTVTVTFSGVPEKVTSAEATTSFLLIADVSISNIACLPGPGVLTVSFAANTGNGNATGNQTGITVDTPASVDVNLPPAAVNVLAHPKITVVVHGKSNTSGKVTITPSYTIGSTCTGATASGTGTPSSVPVTFSAMNLTVTGSGGAESPVPGLEMPLLVLAVLGTLFVARRNR